MQPRGIYASFACEKAIIVPNREIHCKILLERTSSFDIKGKLARLKF